MDSPIAPHRPLKARITAVANTALEKQRPDLAKAWFFRVARKLGRTENPEVFSGLLEAGRELQVRLPLAAVLSLFGKGELAALRITDGDLFQHVNKDIFAIIREAKSAEEIAQGLKAEAYKYDETDIARTLHAIGYDVRQIIRALASVGYDGGKIASGLRSAGYQRDEIACALKAEKYDETHIATGLKEIGYDEIGIANGLKAAGYGLMEIAHGLEVLDFFVSPPLKPDLCYYSADRKAEIIARGLLAIGYELKDVVYALERVKTGGPYQPSVADALLSPGNIACGLYENRCSGGKIAKAFEQNNWPGQKTAEALSRIPLKDIVVLHSMKEAGYNVVEIAIGLHKAYPLGYSGVALLLRVCGCNAVEIARGLRAIGCGRSEIIASLQQFDYDEKKRFTKEEIEQAVSLVTAKTPAELTMSDIMERANLGD